MDGPYRDALKDLQTLGLFYDEQHTPQVLQRLVARASASGIRVKYHYDLWVHEAAKREYGYNACSSDIVLSLDADEWLVFNAGRLDAWVSDDSKSVACARTVNLIRDGIAYGAPERLRQNRNNKQKCLAFKKWLMRSPVQHFDHMWLVGFAYRRKPANNSLEAHSVGSLLHMTLARGPVAMATKVTFYRSLSRGHAAAQPQQLQRSSTDKRTNRASSLPTLPLNSATTSVIPRASTRAPVGSTGRTTSASSDHPVAAPSPLSSIASSPSTEIALALMLRSDAGSALCLPRASMLLFTSTVRAPALEPSRRAGLLDAARVCAQSEQDANIPIAHRRPSYVHVPTTGRSEEMAASATHPTHATDAAHTAPATRATREDPAAHAARRTWSNARADPGAGVDASPFVSVSMLVAGVSHCAVDFYVRSFFNTTFLSTQRASSDASDGGAARRTDATVLNTAPGPVHSTASDPEIEDTSLFHLRFTPPNLLPGDRVFTYYCRLFCELKANTKTACLRQIKATTHGNVPEQYMTSAVR
eukprot:6210844-Pleurochrysis_carterae.AAC.3